MASKLDPVADLDTSKPILIVGPTASGKSRLALAAARRTGGPIVNADALQVYANWRILTARPTLEDEAAWPHLLYGHVSGDTPYSVGDWLREIEPLLTGPPPVIVGGTGLYFTALTEGLADIPPTPPHIRQEATRILSEHGLAALLMDLDPETAARLDQNNPMRVQRAWEVLKATGRSLASWQSETGPPLLPLEDTTPLLLDAPKDWLTPRIETRFDQMIAAGALDEARQNLPTWDPKAPSSKAIGAAELIAYLGGTLTLDEARARAIVATRQYAKRQRSWFRARMSGWRTLPGAML